MIEVRKDADGGSGLTLVVMPPEKPDAGVDPSLAVQRLFSVLSRTPEREPAADQSTQSSPESR